MPCVGATAAVLSAHAPLSRLWSTQASWPRLLAAAKANLIAINKVALDGPGLRVNVTYSCDPGMNHQLVANAEEITSSKLKGYGAGTIKVDKLVCDYADHTAQVRLKPAATLGFEKGDKVKVTVFYFDEDGFRYADTTATATV
ncbi:hypothetical protein [Streptomyces noursei]|uniref:hypothetical protein n=1 Tax=Streptomyces noursei TaxID=1971 RepID=UPI0021553717|nr:hypothetical protein [Streptomyces noursei]